MRGRSVKFVPLFVRTKSFQFTLSSLFSAAKISLGKGTTTSSMFFERRLHVDLARRFGRRGRHRQARPAAQPASNIRLTKGLIRSFDY